MADFTVNVRNNGPYRLEGEGITIRDQDGRIRYQCVFRLDSCRWIKID